MNSQLIRIGKRIYWLVSVLVGSSFQPIFYGQILISDSERGYWPNLLNENGDRYEKFYITYLQTNEKKGHKNILFIVIYLVIFW